MSRMPLTWGRGIPFDPMRDRRRFVELMAVGVVVAFALHMWAMSGAFPPPGHAADPPAPATDHPGDAADHLVMACMAAAAVLTAASGVTRAWRRLVTHTTPPATCSLEALQTPTVRQGVSPPSRTGCGIVLRI